MEFNTVFFTFEPLSHFGSFVILGVVQDQMYLSILVSGDELLQKSQKTVGVEPVDEPKVKFRMTADRYRSHYFQGLPCGRRLHHASDSFQCPMSEDGACQLKAHFILIDQDAFLFLDFFLISGSSSSSHVACLFLSASESSCLGY